ncbi:MAG: hypothetical protein ABWY25_03535 [Paenisporosarcina sp.]
MAFLFVAEKSFAIMKKGFVMNKGIEKLKRFWEEHPMETIGIGILAVTAAAKLLDAMSAAQGRRAYARQVEYRVSSKL